ncbi:hypothetical protein E2562_015192 [Oryza meyeriana var. granulata]|uniref:Proline-rich protein n=1 Tax=Oryza meyeriana var. granulata TaxID=110450 RepID=A0A6G1EWS3_9ORYZ|nr:hypothetical protein E2562_015192 [Oryza meyeriana var. granulata]
MGALPTALVLGVCAAILLTNVLAVATEGDAAAASMVVGLAKCAECTRKNMKAEAVFKSLRVAVKCKNGHGEYETKATGEVDKSGAFSVPLAADLLREDGDCFAQLHSASSNQPCPGQEPSWIVNDAERKTFVAVAGKTRYTSAECSSAFLCDPFHKKDFFFHYNNPSPAPAYKPPSTPVYTHPTPPVYSYPTPVPTYKPPSTPVYTHPTPPVYSYPTPVPTYKPPTPEYSHQTPVYTHPKPSTPIYHPPADEQVVQDPETDPELLPFIKKMPFVFPKYPMFPPMEAEATP